MCKTKYKWILKAKKQSILKLKKFKQKRVVAHKSVQKYQVTCQVLYAV